MSDWKSRAAGEMDENHLPSKSENTTSESRTKPTVSLEFAREALDNLETFTTQKIANPEDRAKWIARLSTVPKWKLLSISDFSGHLGDVWKFFDTLPVPLPNAKDFEIKSLPEPMSNIAIDTVEHYRKMCAATPEIPFTLAEHEQKWAVEIAGLQVLHAKYPRGKFDTALRMRQDDIAKKRDEFKAREVRQVAP